jgi:hypothetical protein
MPNSPYVHYSKDAKNYDTWLSYAISLPNPSGTVRIAWSLNGQTSVGGGVQTGPSGWIEGSVTPAGVFTPSFAHALNTRKALNVYNYQTTDSSLLGGVKHRDVTVFACFRVSLVTPTSPGVTSYLQTINNFFQVEQYYFDPNTGAITKTLPTEYSITKYFNPKVERIGGQAGGSI